MLNSIRIFENSLREYLIDNQIDSYNTKGMAEQKYNNLKVYMEPDKNTVPHFWVSVNISAVCYRIDPVQKIEGGLGSDERLIVMWAGRQNIKGELKKHWIYLTKSKEFMLQQELNKNNIPVNTDALRPEIEEANEYVTGTGINNKLLKVLEEKIKE